MSSRILSGRHTDLGERFSGLTRGAERRSVLFDYGPVLQGALEPISEAVSCRAFNLSACRVIGCHDSADGVSQQASPISGLFVDFDFEARILERAGIIIKRLCVHPNETRLAQPTFNSSETIP